jgi:serine-type D-Ala-D-Ala carboxypeptidase/endopeptidase (penicillin-binding protein 4)
LRRVLAVAFAATGAWTCVATAAPLPASSTFRHTAFAQRLARALDVPQVSRARTGALAFDLRTQRVVYALNPGLPLVPASNEKLTVTYAALVRLGPSFRFRTQVLGTGRRDRAVWRGTLYLRGGGDPTLKVAGLRRLAERLRRSGIRRVAGGVLADESLFDTRRTGPGWKPSFSMNESPPLSALVVARARFHGATTPDPAGAAAALFVKQLERAGVHVGGRSAWGTAPRRAAILASVGSEPLVDVVRFMDRSSDNFTAEMLMKTLGARVLGRGTTAAGAQVVVRTLGHAGVPLRGVRIADGSGLSPRDRLTVRAIAAILAADWQRPALRRYLWRSLAVAGRWGTLADRLDGSPTRGAIFAKTGTTDLASALSGYARNRYVFTVVQDGRPIATGWARKAQDRFATLLAAAARRPRPRATFVSASRTIR